MDTSFRRCICVVHYHMSLECKKASELVVTVFNGDCGVYHFDDYQRASGNDIDGACFDRYRVKEL